MTEQENPQSLALDQKTMDILVTQIIPTSKYFEVRFDHVQQQIGRINSDILEFKKDVAGRFDTMQKNQDKRFDDVNADILEFKKDVTGRFDTMQKNQDKRFDGVTQQFDTMQKAQDKRFEQVDKRFEQVDKRFEQVDKRFEQVDKRFDQMNTKLDKILERIDVKIDSGLRENRGITIRLFSFAIMFSVISVVGMFGRLFKLF